MIRVIAVLVFLGGWFFPLAGFAQELPFKKGEKLTYRLHYGMVDAGIATIELSTKNYTVRGVPAYHAIGLGKTKTFFDLFFKVRDRYETYFDPEKLEALKFVRRINEGGYKKEQDYLYYPEKLSVDVGAGKMMEFPKRNMQDMLSAFYYARTFDFVGISPGDEFELPVFMDEEYYPMKLKYKGVKILKTDLGKIRCLEFIPMVQKGRIFKEDDDLTLWISDDKNKIPVRIQANVLVGSIKVDLTKAQNLVQELEILRKK